MIKINIKQNKSKITLNKRPQRRIKELDDGLDPGVLGKQILIKGENKRIFIDFILKIRKKICTNSKIEEELLKKYIFSSWKLRRLREIEKNILNGQQKFESNEFTFFGEDKIKRRIRNLSKIKIDDEIKENNLEQEKLEKQMVKSLKQLRAEQGMDKIGLVQ